MPVQQARRRPAVSQAWRKTFVATWGVCALAATSTTLASSASQAGDTGVLGGASLIALTPAPLRPSERTPPPSRVEPIAMANSTESEMRTPTATTARTPTLVPAPVTAAPLPSTTTLVPSLLPSASTDPSVRPSPTPAPTPSVLPKPDKPTSSSPPAAPSSPPPVPKPSMTPDVSELPLSPTPVLARVPAATAPAVSPTPLPVSSNGATAVTAYNSTTLPPGLDATILDGGELVSVETRATTHRDGQTSVSYTIVVKKGDQIETMQQPVFNTTDPASVLRTASPPTASSATVDLDALPQRRGASTSVMTLGTAIGLVVAALVLGLLFAVVIAKRRGKHERMHKTSKLAADEGYAALESVSADPRASMNRTRHSSYASEYIASGAQTPRKRRSSSMWEDEVIVAARIPFDKVELGVLLSRGAFGEVYRGTYRGQTVAIKKLLPETRRDLNHIERFLSEIKLQAALEHPHIVAFIGVAWESLSELYALSEFMDRGDLRSFLLATKSEQSRVQGFSADKVKIALHVAHALTYLHSLQPQLLHRDLKSRNILLSSKLDAKLTDFGSSRCRDSDLATMTAGVGSSLWMAPEVMVGRRYDDKSDVFSLGVVLSELDTHELPYAHVKAAPSSVTSREDERSESDGHALPETAVLQLVSTGQLQVQFSRLCQPELVALARQCMRIEPTERPSAAEVLYQLHVVLRTFETR